MKANYFDWNERVVTKLRALWAEGIPVRQIGAELGCNASQVIGKAHRLDLPRRQNPVKRTYEKKAPRPVQAPRHTPAHLWRAPTSVVPKTPPELAWADKVEAVPIAVPQRERKPIPGAASPHRQCQWTDSTQAPWVFCGCAAVPGFSWCAEHKARVFERRAA